MMNTNLTSIAATTLRGFRLAAASALILGVVACGGGGGETTPVTDVSVSPSGLRPLTPDFINRRAVNYSPYATATSAEDRVNEVITDAGVLRDLNLLLEAGIGMIRLFDSDEKVAQRVLRVIQNNDLDMKVYLGMWMGGADPDGNQAQMAYGVALANTFKDIVVAVSVGNESLVSWSGHKMDPKELASNITTVRSQISQPVTTDDNWAYYAAADRAVIDAIDFAAVHTYAMVDTHYLPNPWDWKQLGESDLSKRAAAMMDAAMVATTNDYNAARAFLDKVGRVDMPIVIGETGWMAKDPGAGWYTLLAAPVNQKMYLERLMAWADEGRNGAGPKNVFYFEAFDEPWKGSDDGWGLFTVDREARCSAQSLNPTATWAKTTDSCTDADAVYYAPPVLNAAVTGTPVIHSEAVTGWPTGLRSDAYEGNTFTLEYPATGDSADTDPGNHYIRLSNFAPKAYGWGLLWQSDVTPALTLNMSNFSNGAIHFSVKTGYTGKLRVGISSDTESRQGAEAFVIVSDNDEYGYCTDSNQWCDVSIPLSAFQAANPELDLRYVRIGFSISDVYDSTGNTDATGKPEIRLDNIYWAQEVAGGG